MEGGEVPFNKNPGFTTHLVDARNVAAQQKLGALNIHRASKHVHPLITEAGAQANEVALVSHNIHQLEAAEQA